MKARYFLTIVCAVFAIFLATQAVPIWSAQVPAMAFGMMVAVIITRLRMDGIEARADMLANLLAREQAQVRVLRKTEQAQPTRIIPMPLRPEASCVEIEGEANQTEVMWDIDKAVRETGLTRWTIRRMSGDGEFPKVVCRLRCQGPIPKHLYREEEILAWNAENLQETPGDAETVDVG